MYPSLYNSFAQQQRYRFNRSLPYINSTLATSSRERTSCFRCNFTHNYRGRVASEWVPAEDAKAKPPLIIQTPIIYYTHIGLLPNYGGHVPGDLTRFGTTYGEATRDAKRWLKVH